MYHFRTPYMYIHELVIIPCLLLHLRPKQPIYEAVAPRTRGQHVGTGPRAAVLTGRDVMGGGRPGLDGRAHCTETMPDSSTQNTVGHKGGGRDGTSMAAAGSVGGMRAQSHLKGRRGVQLKLLIQELRKATRSETKGAR